ncbi:MAG: hypothetical protein E3J70_01755 [Candidatus Heimdallarchaeota archaeon]|nr:MAG: hypothetical protein E3J70_01755 [Candidatus Heimdallarchaeota archaeon]
MMDYGFYYELNNIIRIYLPIWHFTEFIVFISGIPVLFFAISLIQYSGINPKLHGDRTLKITSYVWLTSISYFVYCLLFMFIFLAKTDSISFHTFRDDKIMIALYVILSVTFTAFVTTLVWFIRRRKLIKKLDQAKTEGE